MPKKITTEDFISRAMIVHGDKYDYSKSIYTSAKEKVAIVCKKHGVEFYQSPTNHLQGKVGCNKCEVKLKRYPIIGGMKECSKCGELKSVNDFHKGARRCKDCTLIDAKLRYESKVSSNKTIIDKREIREEIAKAKFAGKKHYYSNVPCKNGHIGKRLVSTNQCCKCLQERKRSQRMEESALKRKAALVKRMVAKNLGLPHYSTGEPCKHGHVSPRLVSTRQCIECLRLRESHKTKPSIDARNRINARRRKREARAKRRKYQSEVLFNRPDYRMRVFMRGCLKRLMTSKNGSRTEKLLGYSRFSLVSRIEFQFKDGMSWENYGEWHIDHKKPISRFLAQGITEPKIINALSNLQPLWAKDNLSKGDRF
nr:MAG TPA: Protein of unknown function (DUF723) [Caudoviricetes sp.]